MKKANGEGSISRYNNGWRAAITLGRDDNGKLIRKQFYGKTKLEALSKMNEYKNKYDTGALPSDEKITLQQWFKIWIYEYRINDLRPSTLERYDGIYRNYIKNSNIGMMKLKDLRTSNIQAYYNTLVKDKNKTPDTIKTINKVLKSVLSQAMKESYIPKNYCNNIILPKISAKEEIQIFTVEEQQRFITSLDNHRNRALFILVLGTGLRIGEVVALKWNDIDLEKGELKVQRTFKRVGKLENLKAGDNRTEIIEQLPKTKYSERTIPIPSTIIKELKSHKKRQNEEKFKAGEAYINNDLVFPNELGQVTDTRNLSRSYGRILNRSGIKYKKFHALRHTYATRLFENEVPLKTVQILMGHSNIKITADIYTHVMPEEKIKAVEKINKLFAL